MVQTIAAFLEFCYLVRRPSINQDTIRKIEDCLHRFHTHRKVFQTTGVQSSFSLPCQHSLMHYIWAIQQFGAPNGLCTSLTESRHITTVKEPWRQSNWFEALRQILTINQRLHKLGAARADFEEHGMLKGNIISATLNALLHTQGKSNQEDLLLLAEDHSAEVPVGESIGVGLSAAQDGATVSGSQTEQASLPPDDNESPVDGKQIVRFVDLTKTPHKSCSLLLLVGY